MLRRAEEIDRDEDELYGLRPAWRRAAGGAGPREGRLKKIREAKAALEAEAKGEGGRGEGKDAGSGEAGGRRRSATSPIPESKIQKTARRFHPGLQRADRGGRGRFR